MKGGGVSYTVLIEGVSKIGTPFLYSIALSFHSPFEKGFGDYIELAIDADGTVQGWPKMPDFSEFIEKGEAPEPVKSNKWHRAENVLLHIRSMNLCKNEIAWLVERLQEINNPNK